MPGRAAAEAEADGINYRSNILQLSPFDGPRGYIHADIPEQSAEKDPQVWGRCENRVGGCRRKEESDGGYSILSTPTAVSFSIVGTRRCEILGGGKDRIASADGDDRTIRTGRNPDWGGERSDLLTSPKS